MERRPGVGCFFGAAMLAAPFLALLYGWNAGLAVMAAALAATTGLAIQAGRTAPPEVRRRLLPVAVVNGLLAAACLVALIWRVI